MSFGEDDLGAFGALTRAIGLTRGASGDNNPDWFSDPVGGTGSEHSNANGFATILSDDDQRNALTEFVDSTLGPPTGHDDDSARWVPLFANDDPAVTVYAVLEPTGSASAGTVRVGVGVEHSTGSGADPLNRVSPKVTTRLHVPIAHVARGTDSRPTDGPNPSWLLLGSEGGRIGVEVEATFTDAAPVAGEAFLRGMSVSVGIPTGPEPVAFSLSLIDLQLPGATAPTTRTLTLDDLATVGTDLIEFIVGLVRAQVAALSTTDVALAKVRALAGMFGLRDGVTNLPALPLHDIIERGLPALVEWVEDILEHPASLTAWLGEVATLTDGVPNADRNAVSIPVGPCTVLVGLAVAAGTGGHPTLTPWVELAYGTRSGAEARAHVDLLCADTGTGSATAIPALRAEAVFGLDAGGTRLFAGTTADFRLASVHVGIRLDEARRPAFVLTLHEVGVPGQAVRTMVDLSSPDAAIDVADDVLDGVLSDALDGLGDAGALLKILLGVDPPGAVASPGILDIVRDPVATMRDYWLDVTGDQTAMTEALAALRQLLLGAVGGGGGPVIPGTGIESDPWRIVLGDDDTVGLDFWREDNTLRLAISASADLDLLDDLRVDASARLSLLTVDLSSGATTFLDSVVGRAGIGPRGADPAVFALGGGLAIEAPRLGVDLTWSPRSGVRVAPSGAGIALRVPSVGALLGGVGAAGAGASDLLPIPLPRLDARGNWDPDWAPDWAALEPVIGNLLRRLGSDVLTALADLVGWGDATAALTPEPTVRARLALDVLLTDPAAAIEQWLLDVTLDCRRLGAALRPIAWLLSAGSLSAPLGQGRPERPWLLPVGGAAGAPGLAVWTVPGCRPDSPRRALTEALDLLTGASVPSAATTATVLATVAPAIPDLADLLRGRAGLGLGLTGLVSRWSATDGLIGVPTTTDSGGHQVLSGDSGVTVTVREGMTYAALVASARLGTGLPVTPGVGGVPTAVVHIGCDGGRSPGWLELVPSGQRVDATGAHPATVPATGDGPWFVLVPSVAAAAADRPDHDGLRAQSERVAAALSARTAPVLLVGHGGAGAATVRATGLSNVATLVDDVVTVGTPWGPVATTAFETDLSGDALRLLTALAPTELPAMPDTALALGSSPERQALDVLWRSRTEPAQLPSALAVSRDPSVRVHACFATLERLDLERVLGAFVAQAVHVRLRALEALPAGPPQEVHVGLDLPIIDGTIGELLLGASARVDLLAVDRAAPHLRPLREVTVSFSVGVADGWLVGGPGALQHDLECRWAAVSVHVPLDGTVGRTEVTLHEARAHTAYREVWVVTGDETGAPPEVRILLGEVVARLRANADFAGLLTAIGLLRDGGLDPGGLDRLLHDPAATLRSAVMAAPQQVATAIRALIGGVAPSDVALTAFRIASGPAQVTIDLATATITGALTIAEPVPVTVTLTATPAGVGLDVGVGSLDDALGGVRLVGHAGTGGATLRLDHAAPGRAVVPIGLLPNGNAESLVPLATTLLPALLLQGLGTALRELIEDPLLDECLSAAGLLGTEDPESGDRDLVLPMGLISDPGGWLRARVDPLASTVTLLDAAARVLKPGSTSGIWQLTDDVSVTYAVVSGRLQADAHVSLAPTIDGRPITTNLTGGLSIGLTGPPVALLDVRVTVDGWGLDLGVGGSDPAPVRLDLVRPTPESAIRLVPAGPGLGSALASGAESLIVLALNELLPHRSDAASLRQQVAQATFDICGALDLLVANRVDKAKLDLYTQPPGPGAVLLTRLPALASTGLAVLADALDPGHAVVASSLTGMVRRFDLGALDGSSRPFKVVIDGSGTPSVSFGCDIALGDWGQFAVEELRLDATGVRVALRGGPFVVALGPTTLRPVVVIRAGVAGGEFSRLVAIGLAVDDIESVQLRWGLDAQPPKLWAITGGTTPGELDTPEAIAADLLGIGVEIVSGLVSQQLGTVISTRATTLLKDVVFSNAQRRIDPGFVRALFHPEQLLGRLQTLAWNCATITPGFSLDIGDQVTIGLVAEPTTGSNQRIGVRLDVQKPLELSGGDPKVELVSRADWITGTPPAGLSTLPARRHQVLPRPRPQRPHRRAWVSASPAPHNPRRPRRVLDRRHRGQPLRRGGRDGLGGGVRLKLDGLAVAPAGGGGDNGDGQLAHDRCRFGERLEPAVVQPVVRPAEAPRPTEGVGVTLRAGDPPGPWWLVIQRQLGPLYVERVGLDTAETGGSVTRDHAAVLGPGLALRPHRGRRRAVASAGTAATSARPRQLGGRPHGPRDLRRHGRRRRSPAACSRPSPTARSRYVGMLLGRFARLRAVGLRRLHRRPRRTRRSSSSARSTARSAGRPRSSSPGIGGGLGINRGLVVPDRPVASSASSRSSRRSTRAPHRPPTRWPSCASSTSYFPHAAWATSGSPPASASTASPSSTASRSSRSRSATASRSTCSASPGWRCPGPAPRSCRSSSALLARFSTSEGVFLIKAQLTDNSWLLYQDVRLTGGFAFAIWLKGPLAGQFVLTHRRLPPGLPPRRLPGRAAARPRLAGQRRHRHQGRALLRAHVRGADGRRRRRGQPRLRPGLGQGRVRRRRHRLLRPVLVRGHGLRPHLRRHRHRPRWFGTISFSITIGAKIKVWGPDFAGEARVRGRAVHGPVEFGSQAPIEPSTLRLGRRSSRKYLEDAGDAARALSAITGRGTLPTATGERPGCADRRRHRRAAVPGLRRVRADLHHDRPAPPMWTSDSALPTAGAARPVQRRCTTARARADGCRQASPRPSHVSLERASTPGGAGSPTADPPARPSPATSRRSRPSTDSFPLGVWGRPGAGVSRQPRSPAPTSSRPATGSPSSPGIMPQPVGPADRLPPGRGRPPPPAAPRDGRHPGRLPQDLARPRPARCPRRPTPPSPSPDPRCSPSGSSTAWPPVSTVPWPVPPIAATASPRRRSAHSPTVCQGQWRRRRAFTADVATVKVAQWCADPWSPP